MGAINSVRRLTIQCLGLLEALEPTTVEIENKATAIHVMQSLIRDKWPHLTLRPFGSSENGFGCGSSDLDIGVFFDPPALVNSLSWNDRLQVLASIASILTLHDGMELHQFIFHARVPLVKLWDSRRKLAIDISIGSSHAVGNTLLLKRYGEMDPRVRPLVFAVKHWAKQRGLNDASNGTLSSYAWIMLVLFFLQSRGILPALNPTDESDDCASSSLTSPTSCSSGGSHSSVSSSPPSDHQQCIHPILCSHPPTTPPSGMLSSTSGGESVGSLLVGFFQFYAFDFDYRCDVVSLRCGQALPKHAKWGLGLGTWRFSIEDPLDVHHDVARVIFHPKGQARLLDELRRAAAMTTMATCQLDDLCAAPSSSSCFICDAPGHAPRDCTASSSSSINMPPPPRNLSTISSDSSIGSPTTATRSPLPPPPPLRAVPPHAKMLKRPRRRSKSKGGAKKKLLVAWRSTVGS
ncbi:hypothetical protein H257_09746 [Aphanomyces astaci]|uniref:CCHC-type domain-containing protein n=3 Tax=Aphanomyces astaci TaxID=112090 RepID=W4G981_APHAT|nr:hypothetical protein H257_09746 [Aphanomyces astaci]ETV76257.1 hypothetical protein H257_09746 [Aphanomyces astaci]|eukprot:XP_009834382.1 hypothetical protein H257_09746 [Aphanomyces astaci]